MDNLFSLNRLDAIEIPRIAHFTTGTVLGILNEDRWKGVNGLETYGKLAVRPLFEPYNNRYIVHYNFRF